ncbi:unnamed protein product, partial [Ectocarpus sp. 12 AP-2014]
MRVWDHGHFGAARGKSIIFVRHTVGSCIQLLAFEKKEIWLYMPPWSSLVKVSWYGRRCHDRSSSCCLQDGVGSACLNERGTSMGGTNEPFCFYILPLPFCWLHVVLIP